MRPLIDGVTYRRVYIAGPMTGLPDYNRAAFAEAEAMLAGTCDAAEVINPNELWRDADGSVPRWPREKFMRLDLGTLVNRADTVVLLDGWESSPGACVERAAAEACGIGVRTLADVQREAIAEFWRD